MIVTPLTTVLGAEIGGLQLRPDLPDGDIDAVRQALLDHKVLFFRGQSLGAAELTALAHRFGEPTPAHPVEPAVEGHPQVLALDSDEGARADVWHSDLTFQERPPLGAMLHAKLIPPVGGDTIWADLAAAYDALSPILRGFLDQLTATHSATKAGGYFAARNSEKTADTTSPLSAALARPVHHPVVRCHPETGRRSVFVNPLFTDKIDGLRRRESDGLLGLIQEAATAPERLVRWRWQEGDLAFWDNRCTMHYALLDFDGRRMMERVALEGDRPQGASRGRQ
jgi:alpha-ketoglutarate-dependent taurine dioxygenase